MLWLAPKTFLTSKSFSGAASLHTQVSYANYSAMAFISHRFDDMLRTDGEALSFEVFV